MDLWSLASTDREDAEAGVGEGAPMPGSGRSRGRGGGRGEAVENRGAWRPGVEQGMEPPG